MTHNHSTISIHNHSTLLGLGLENDGKQMISNCLQGKLDRLWMIRGGSSLVMRGGSTLGRIDRFPMRASREANEYCSSPFLEHSTQLSKRTIPKRFYHLFDRLGANTQNYRPGIRWCNKCATIACLLYTSPSPRDGLLTRMPSSA